MVKAYLNTNEREVKNNAGGLVYTISDMDRLDRFLILGTVGGTYYVGERELTNENLVEIERIIASEGKAAVDRIVEIGKSGRAPKHDPTLVAYAIACANPNTSAYALGFFNDIVRIGTHLFHFLAYIDGRRGWGRTLRRAVANWYLSKDDKALALQLVKYKQRDGWSHRDALRLAHPQATSQSQNALLKYAVSGDLLADDSEAHEFVEASEAALAYNNEELTKEDVAHIVGLINQYNLPREVLPTNVMKDPAVWEALAPRMGLTALLRNLRNMHKNGYLVQGSDAVRVVRDRLTDAEALRKARVHPAHLFLAKFNATDIPKPIQTALEDAFMLSFKNVVPTNKRIMLALDVSGSMGMHMFGGGRTGAVTPTAREWSALMAMVTARTEPYAEFMAFSQKFVPIDITPRDSMEDVIRKTSALPFSGTDCSLPMFYARNKNESFDAFCVYTDNETWAGGARWGGDASTGNAMAELRKYRQSSAIHDAKLVVVGITSTGFSIADPNDFNTLDVVGFDSDAPSIIADFIRK